MLRFSFKVIVFAALLTVPPHLRVGENSARYKFKAAIVPDHGEQWEWYCDDPRENPARVEVVYWEGTGDEIILEQDPDLCDSEVAQLLRP